MRDRILGVFLRELTLYRRFKPYVGKMGFPAQRSCRARIRNEEFQSLVGVYGFSRQGHPDQGLLWFVSIPSRGLWVFPPPVFEAVAVFGFQGSFPVL